MSENDYSFVARMLLERSAIVLEPGKEYLLESRLAPVARGEHPARTVWPHRHPPGRSPLPPIGSVV